MLGISLALGLIASAAQSASVTGRPSVPKTTAVFAGHVLDEDGAPLLSAWVSASRWKTVAGKRRFAESHSVQVDADGYFLIAGLPPGIYTLSASPEDDPDASGGVQAYRPTVANESIQLSAGSEVRDLRIVLSNARVFAISGTAVNAVTGEPITDAQLLLTPIESENTDGHSTRIRDGVFRFANVLPGTYLIQTNPNDLTRDAETAGYRKVGLYGRLLVVVGESDVQDVNVRLGSGGEIAGRFQMVEPGTMLPAVGLALGPLEGVGAMLSVPVEADGRFHLSKIQPDRYQLHITPPQGSYVLTIRANGQEIKDALDLSDSGVVRIEILLSPNAA